MKVIYSLQEIDPSKPSIFLGGCTIRLKDKQNKISWREQAITYFKDMDIQIIYPEFENDIMPSDWTYSRQVSWETKMLKQATYILFWIPRNINDKMYGFTTNIEFGEYLNSNKIFVGSPINADNNDYLRQRCATNNIRWFDDLELLCKEVINAFNPTTKYYFTSDTHFSEDRTRQLSKRPFNSVEDMNNTILSNFKNALTDNDVLYHLGDFGNFHFLSKFISSVKFKTMYILKGNYDKELENLINDPTSFGLTSDITSKIIPIYDPVYHINLDNQNFYLTHYPSNMLDPNKFYLYGHIHALGMVRTNGLNVGVDCHYFNPISLDTVLFFKNAIQKFYDHDVWFDVRL